MSVCAICGKHINQCVGHLEDSKDMKEYYLLIDMSVRDQADQMDRFISKVARIDFAYLFESEDEANKAQKKQGGKVIKVPLVRNGKVITSLF